MEDSQSTPVPRKRRRFSRAIIMPALLIFAYGALVIFNLFTKPAAELGINNGRLAACPDSPNCVSSQAEPKDDVHYVEPLPVSPDSDLPVKEVTEKLKDIVDGMPRTKLIEQKDNYLRFEFTTTILRFVDDVEFFVTDDKIHVRSASRIGRSDLGANRKRVESIRQTWQSASE